MLWEKKEMLITSIFSFLHNIFQKLLCELLEDMIMC